MMLGLFNWSGVSASGVQRRLVCSMKSRNPSGITPIISYDSPFSWIVWPSTSESPANRLCQNPSLRMTTRLAPKRSSSSRKSRPMVGSTPYTSK